MIKYNKKILILVLASCMLASTPSLATVKLEATGPAADVLNKIEKIKEKIEDVQSKILKEKEKWTKKAESSMDKTLGTEGSALFKQYVVKPGAGVVKSAASGQFNAGDFSLSGYTDAIKSEIGNYKLDYATLATQSRDIMAADSMAKHQKSKEIDKQIATLRAEWDLKVQIMNTMSNDSEALDVLSDAIDDLAKRIAELERQKAEISNDISSFEKSNELVTEMASLQKIIADQNSKITQDEMLKKLNAEALSLFTIKNEEEDASALYAEKIDRLFLGEYVPKTSENMAKIRMARKEEFFKSEKNLVNVIINTYKSIAETKDKMLKCDQARDNAEAIFGQETMRVCIDVQIAKVAAQYMEMLLAQIRHEAALEIQNWSNQDRLPDYRRDYTKFSMDDYVVTKDDLSPGLKKVISSQVSGAINSFKGF